MTIENDKLYHVITVGEMIDEAQEGISDIAEEVNAAVAAPVAEGGMDPNSFVHKALALLLSQGIMSNMMQIRILAEASEADRILMISECASSEPHGQAYVKGEDIEDVNGTLYVKGADAIKRPARELKLMSDEDMNALLYTLGVKPPFDPKAN